MTQVLTSAPGGLAVSERVEERLRGGELTQAQVDEFRDFLVIVFIRTVEQQHQARNDLEGGWKELGVLNQLRNIAYHSVCAWHP